MAVKEGFVFNADDVPAINNLFQQIANRKTIQGRVLDTIVTIAEKGSYLLYMVIHSPRILDPEGRVRDAILKSKERVRSKYDKREENYIHVVDAMRKGNFLSCVENVPFEELLSIALATGANSEDIAYLESIIAKNKKGNENDCN